MGEGPGLTSEIFYVLDLYSHLLLHLSHHGLLQRLTRLNKSSENTVHPRHKMTGSRQKQLIASLDKNNDRRSQARKMEQTTLGTFFGPFGGLGRQAKCASV